MKSFGTNLTLVASQYTISNGHVPKASRFIWKAKRALLEGPEFPGRQKVDTKVDYGVLLQAQ